MSIRFPPSMIGPDFRIIHTQVTVGSPAGIIIGASPNRVLLYFHPVTGASYVVGPAPLVLSSRGIQVAFGSAPVLIDYGTWGQIVCQEWYGIQVAGPAATVITQVLYDPKG